MSVRIGQGIDVHRFSEDPHRPLVLGGVDDRGRRAAWAATATPTPCATRWPTPSSVRWVWATSGRHFPDTDPAWEGADSVALLTEVVGMAASATGSPAPTPTAPSCADAPPPGAAHRRHGGGA